MTAHCKSRNQESSSDLLLRDRSYLHQLKWFQLTVYNELEVQTFKQLFYQHEFSVKLKLKILGWIFWFVISLIFFLQYSNFPFKLFPLLLPLLKDSHAFFFSCWRFSSFVYFSITLCLFCPSHILPKKRVQRIE